MRYCCTTHEIHQYLRPISVSLNSTNRSNKSYWSDKLTCLWKEAKQRERAYIKHGNDDKASLKANFVFAQHNFDSYVGRYAFENAQTLSLSK